MGKVLEIGISENKINKIVNVKEVEAIKGKGLVGEKHFKENNKKRSQITLIEMENINLTSDIVSCEVSQPIKGLIPVFNVSNSRNHFLLFLLPDCIAVLVGL